MNEVFSFDPDKFVPQTEPPPAPLQMFEAPGAWLHGLSLLRDRRAPRGAVQARWDQIIADATKLTTIWAHHAVEAKWSIEDLFGFDPDGDHGLAVALRGQRLICINEAFATVEKSGGGRLYHHAEQAPGTPLLWTFDERKL